jgi:hypothetical protein
MQSDSTQRTDQTDETERAADKVEELPQQPISASDAEAVKGGSIVYQSPQLKQAPSANPGVITQSPQFKL